MFAPLIYGGLYYKNSSRKGAVAAFLTGAVCSGLFYRLHLPVYWAFPATACSAAVFFAVPWLERLYRKRTGKGGNGREEQSWKARKRGGSGVETVEKPAGKLVFSAGK